MKTFQQNLLAKYFIIAVLALVVTPAFAQVSVSINIAPPPLQVYEQPACPDDGYIWTPGYWAYGDNAYYWVPGAWVQPPQVGMLWTPPYWGSDGNAFVFYPGYWGASVGYYGGINYGYGYGGNGYGGGRWQGGHFSYNTAVNNVSSIHSQNTYVDRAAINSNTSKASYNGGKGGVQAQPTPQEKQSSNARNIQPTSVHQSPTTQAPENREPAVMPHDQPAATSVHQAPTTQAPESRGPAVQPHDQPAAAQQSQGGDKANSAPSNGPNNGGNGNGNENGNGGGNGR